MPKKLKNGSIISGYTTLQHRVRVKELDNKEGSYPAKHRCGDLDRSGTNLINPFNDQNTLVFGSQISDKFDNSGYGYSTLLNQKKWNNSSGIAIKKELIKKNNGEIIENPVLTISGDNSTRFISTREKIKNPIIVFDLLQGPHNQIKGGLNLSKGLESDKLLAQISTDGTSWTTIRTFTPTDNLRSFYGVNNIKNGIYRKQIKITRSDIPHSHSRESYYFRLVQLSIEDKNKYTWGIANIDIKFYNSNITYGIGVNLNQQSGINVKNKLIATQHTTGTMTGSGLQIPSIITDEKQNKVNIESISPFNEEVNLIDNNNDFYRYGTKPELIDGFSQSVKSKTKFVIDVSPSEETTFGYINKLSGFDDGDGESDVTKTGQQLMVYWNNELKKWEKIGKELHFNNYPTPSRETMQTAFTSSCLGFGRSSVLGTYDSSNTQLSSKNVLATSHKPISLHAFPIGPQYHATGSQYILAKDIGITKPFLLEKIEVRCQSKFESPSTGSAGSVSHKQSSLAMCPVVHDNRFGFGNLDYTETLRIITPTFFMLRQFTEVGEFKIEYFDRSVVTSQDKSSYTFSIPGDYNIVNGNNDLVNVSESRELITYAQHSLFLTGSPGGSGFNFSEYSVQDIIDQGYPSDSFSVHSFNVESSINPSDIPFSLTQSLDIKAPCRNTSNYPDIHTEFTKVSSGPTYTNLGYGKTNISRSENIKNARAPVNGNASVKLTKTEEFKSFPYQNNAAFSTQLGPDSDSIDQESPFLILPGDKIILGWQYPLKNSLRSDYGIPGDDSTSGFNSMTLFGNAKIYLYGSLVSNKAEYHETINQNLTSFGVSETSIGVSKDIDQYQLSYQSEHSGSYIDKFLVDNRDLSNIKYSDNITKVPKDRIGIFSKSIANKKNDVESLGLTFTDSIGSIRSLQRLLQISSDAEKYHDSGKKTKFYFNYEKFGTPADLFYGTKDSKYVNVKNQKFVSSPISIIFVSEEYSKESFVNNKSFVKRDVVDLLRFKSFQSSNLNTEAVVSLPFIDNNTPQNRTYTATNDFVPLQNFDE